MDIILSTDAPAPIGAYSQAVRAGEWVICSGQVPIDPKLGKIVDGNFKQQVEQVLQNLSAVLQAAGLGLNHVVKTTVFMTDLTQFAVVNEVYQRFFKEPYPARAAVQVSALPAGAKVEIEAWAIKKP